MINGLNLYAYCNNNPVMHIHLNGKEWEYDENEKPIPIEQEELPKDGEATI